MAAPFPPADAPPIAAPRAAVPPMSRFLLAFESALMVRSPVWTGKEPERACAVPKLRVITAGRLNQPALTTCVTRPATTRLRQISGEAKVALKVSPRWLLPVLRVSTRRTETVEYCAAAVPGKPASKASAPNESDVKNLVMAALQDSGKDRLPVISLVRTATVRNRTVQMC